MGEIGPTHTRKQIDLKEFYGLNDIKPLTKKCKRCKKRLSLDSFGKHTREKDGKQKWCRFCSKEYNAQPSIKEAEKQRRILARYGLDKEMYKSLDRKAIKTCQICGSEEGTDRWGEPTQPLGVDHCHKECSIRGLLCSQCNAGLGKLGDNIEGLMQAVEYLKREPFYLRDDLHPCKITREWTGANETTN